MNPSIVILVITVAVSVWAFQDRRILNGLILSPYAAVHHNQWYRVVSHAFIHADWMHLGFNMIALWSFGEVVYFYFGEITSAPTWHFCIMYFVAIMLSSLHDLIKQKDNPAYLTLGASGAVSAVIFSAIFFDPWSTILIFFIPCPGIIFGIVYLIYSNYMSKKGGDGINHNAHFYGSVFGFLYPILIDPDSIYVFLYVLMHPTF